MDIFMALSLIIFYLYPLICLSSGVVEVADLILINKADGELLPAARKVQAEYISALKLLRRPSDVWTPRVYPVSSLQDTGFEKAWAKMQQFQVG